MRVLPRCFLAIVVTAVFVSGAYSQTPPPTQAKPGVPQAPARDTKAPKAATGVIKGRVTGADNGAPLRRARMVLSAPGLERPLHAATDGQGRYEFTELPAGRYTLKASKSAYVTLEYGQRRAFEGGKPIELADGATLDKVDMSLPRGGVISGTVVDDMGEPVAGISVTALRSQYGEGKRKLVATGITVQANDLGQYRLYGLQPGAYFVGTRSTPFLLDGYPSAPSYYPGTLNPAEGQRVTVRVGQERGGVDLMQPPGRLARVSGAVVDSAARPLTGASVSIVSPSTGYMLSAPVKPDGSFLLSNVAPGEYVLAAIVRGPGIGDLQQTMLPITITGEDLAGLVLQMTPGSRVIGRIVSEEGRSLPSSPAGIRVDPLPMTTDVPIRIQNIGTQGIVSDDWSFEMKGLGGTMLFRPSRLPAGYMLKSVLLDGRDVTDTLIDIRGTEDLTGLQVVVTSRVTEINGAPRDAKGQPLLEYTVVVFAEDAARWKYPSRFLATARPDQQGRFRIANLPPGRYLAVALEYLEEGQSEDPDYLEALRPLATRFTLGEGETKTLDLKVTKADGT
jgi:hypothetical protein